MYIFIVYWCRAVPIVNIILIPNCLSTACLHDGAPRAFTGRDGVKFHAVRASPRRGLIGKVVRLKMQEKTTTNESEQVMPSLYRFVQNSPDGFYNQRASQMMRKWLNSYSYDHSVPMDCRRTTYRVTLVAVKPGVTRRNWRTVLRCWDSSSHHLRFSIRLTGIDIFFLLRVVVAHI